MANSNRDRVGRGFELLAEGLFPYVDQRMRAAAPGGDWLGALAARDSKSAGSRTYNKNDPAVLLRMIFDDWRVFKDHLPRVYQHRAGELRDSRNRWAHNETFSSEESARILETMELLLTEVGAPQQAEQVRGMRDAIRQALFEAETRKAVKASSGIPAVPGLGLKPWREVVNPHKDVRSGDFNLSQFAADLHLVATGGSVGRDYSDPVEFFQRTYLTEGLRDLLARAVARIGGDGNASPVINLQSNFGGGKTHSMLTLWHLFSGHELAKFPQDLQDLVAAVPRKADSAQLQSKVQRVALVGTRIAANQPSVKDDGTEVRTLWGELAWQLGGREAYDLVADSDRSATSPGDALRELLTLYAPCLILIDEWVAYARQLYGSEQLAGGSFDTQFTFAQTLTEVVKSVPGALLVISIPASDTVGADDSAAASTIEVGGPAGKAALDRLQNVVRRVADQWRPATARESFEIVRRRLFEDPSPHANVDISAVARQFMRFYAEHKGEFPAGCGEPPYEARIKAAYPIHPELFDRLYEDWSTLERFQRTRGVLRLMSAVVHALWVGNDASPMIMPGSVPLDVDKVLSDLSQYLEDSWKAIVDTDVDGAGSTPVRIDGSRTTFGQRALTRRIARTIFIGSAATLNSAHKGIDWQRVRLGVAVPGDTVGNFGSALQVLSDQATYLYVDGGRYWYDTQPSVTRMARDYAERLHDEDVWKELRGRLRRDEAANTGDFVRVHVCPESPGDVPDWEDARLVVLHPQYLHTRGSTTSPAMLATRDLLDKRSAGNRLNKNTLVFLAPDGRRVAELQDAVRDYLAWSYIKDRQDELDLSKQQRHQVKSRLNNADQAVQLRIAATWIWALLPVQPNPGAPLTWDTVKVEGSEDRLAVRASAKLRNQDQLRVAHAPRLIRADLDRKLAKVWDVGHIQVGELWGYYCQYPYLARLRDRSVLDQGIRDVLNEITWEAEGFALADSFDEKAGCYRGLALPHEDIYGQIADTTLLVHPTLATTQREAERAEAEARRSAASGERGSSSGNGPVGGNGGSTGTPETERDSDATRPVDPVPDPPRPANTRFFGAVKLNPERYGRDLARLGQEILQHLADEDVDLEVTVEISARYTPGFSTDKVRTVTENARTLKFDEFGFEDS